MPTTTTTTTIRQPPALDNTTAPATAALSARIKSPPRATIHHTMRARRSFPNGRSQHCLGRYELNGSFDDLPACCLRLPASAEGGFVAGLASARVARRHSPSLPTSRSNNFRLTARINDEDLGVRLQAFSRSFRTGRINPRYQVSHAACPAQFGRNIARSHGISNTVPAARMDLSSCFFNSSQLNARQCLRHAAG